MIGLSVSIVELLIKGIPESFLFVLALFIFTRTKLTLNKYLIMSICFTIVTYLTRWLPINIGTNTMLSLLVLIFIFLIANKIDLRFIVKTIISVILIALIILISEAINIFLLSAFVGMQSAEDMLNSGNAVEKSLSALPSIIIFGIVVLIVYLVMKKRDKKRTKHGEDGKGAGT